jgi:PAS domain S-box-containing protein
MILDNSDRQHPELNTAFLALVSATSDIVYEMSADWHEMHFFTGKELLAATEAPRCNWIETYIPETDKPQVKTAIAQAIATRSNFELEHRVIRLDGTVGWMFSRAIPLLDKAGEIIKWVGTGSDITERIETEAALRESVAKYRSLFTSINNGFCLLEVLFDEQETAYDYRFLEVNEAFEAQSGLSEAAGKTALELVPNLEPQWAEKYGQVAKSGKAIRFEADVPSMNRIFDIYAFPSGASGEHTVAVIFTDISDRKRHEANQALLAEITNKLVGLNDIDETMKQLGTIIGRHFDVKYCMFAEHTDELETAIAYGWNDTDVPSIGGTYRMRDFLADAELVAILAGEPLIVSDTQTDERVSAGSYAALNIHSFIIVPLLRDHEWQFQISIIDNKSRTWRKDEVELMRELTTRIWARLERARAEKALRDSEERLRVMIENLPGGAVFVVDRDLRYLLAEGEALSAAGFKSEDLVGKTIFEALVPELAAYYEEKYRQALGGKSFVHEHNAHDLWYVTRGTPLRLSSGETYAVLAVSYEISDRKQAEAAIAADLRDTQLLQELATRLVTEGDIQTLYQEIISAAIALTHADAGTVQILDHKTQDLLLLATQGFDRTMTDHFYRVDGSSNTSCGIALRNGSRSFIDFDVLESEEPDSSMRMHVEVGYLSAQSTPLISRSGRAIGMVSTHWRKHHRPSDRQLRFLDLLARQAADLIEQRQTEAEREQLLQQEQAARAEANRANRIKDQFLAVLSHELRTPLNPILGWTRLLQTGRLDGTQQRDALERIERNAKLQTQLIEDLLDISRIMRGKLSLTVAAVSLTTVITAAVETVRLAADAKQIQILLDLSTEIPPVSGDAARLQQVVWNLLSNAVKFTPNGGRVTVELRQFEGLAQIRVIDTGKGIDSQFLPHVFEYFCQEDSSSTRKFGGLGLGLAIVRQIVEMHGGTVQVESLGEDRGAAFTVELPMIQQVVLTESQPFQAQGKNWSEHLSNLQILLVDDEADTLEYQAFLLEQSGATVVAVASSSEALQVLERSIPDVLVSDIGMAEMDGYMLIQHIRDRPPDQGGTIPAIAVTAYAQDFDRRKAFQSGFQAHITKPVEPEVLIKTITGLLDSNN